MIRQLSLALFILLFLCSSVFAAGNKIDKGLYNKISLSNKFYTNKTEALLLKTGQVTSYYAGDDGDLELGIAHSYTVLTVGQYAGTVNVTINGKIYAFSNACVQDNNTGKMWARTVPQSNIGPATDGKLFWDQYTLGPKTDISFDAATKIIHSVAGDFDIDTCCIGRKIAVSGAAQAGNNQDVTVAAITTNNMTVNEVLVNEGAGASVSFASVDDLIWDLKDQANSGSGIAGYTDWRIPNLKELGSIVDLSQDNPTIDTTAFPSTPGDFIWTSSSDPRYTRGFCINFDNGIVSAGYKDKNKFHVRLVRN